MIIGGGIIGCSIAWRLASAGRRVILCDAGVLGGEASWAGAGMLVPGSEYSRACPELTFALESLAAWPGFAAQLERESDTSIDFELCGALELAGSPAEFEKLRTLATTQRRLGIDCRVVEAQELRGMVPGLTAPLEGAVYFPKEGQVDPRTVTAALRIACQRAGVEIREHTRVTRLIPRDGAVSIESSDGGVIEAARAVIAAGAWSNLIDAGVRLPRCFPVRGHLIGYALSAGSLPHVLRFHHTYAVQRRGGYTIAGTSEEQVGFDRTLDPATVDGIAARAHALAGGIIPAVAQDAWIGFRPGAKRGPSLGRLDDTAIWLAYGHYRNGILLAPATAARIAGEIISSLESRLA